jgi:hypothetical protein
MKPARRLPAAGGSTRVIIQKTYPSATGSEPQVMEAFVYVDSNGKVTLASYGQAKAIPAEVLRLPESER